MLQRVTSFHSFLCQNNYNFNDIYTIYILLFILIKIKIRYVIREIRGMLNHFQNPFEMLYF